MNKRQLNEKMEEIVREKLNKKYQTIFFHFKNNIHLADGTNLKNETILYVIDFLLQRKRIYQLLGSDDIKEALNGDETAEFYIQLDQVKKEIEDKLPEALEMHKKPKHSKKTKKPEYPKETEADKQRKQEAGVRAEAERANRLRRKREAREAREEEIAKSSAARKDKPVKQPLSEKTEGQLIEEFLEQYEGLDIGNNILEIIDFLKRTKKCKGKIAEAAIERIISGISVEDVDNFAMYVIDAISPETAPVKLEDFLMLKERLQKYNYEGLEMIEEALREQQHSKHIVI